MLARIMYDLDRNRSEETDMTLNEAKTATRIQQEGILMHAQTVLDMTTEFAKSDALAAKRATANKLKRDTNGVNDALYGLGRTSHESVPLDTVNELLMHYGFDRLESMLLCGREGRLHEAVGRNRWLALTWYKYESGRYEVVAYVS